MMIRALRAEALLGQAVVAEYLDMTVGGTNVIRNCGIEAVFGGVRPPRRTGAGAA